MLSTRREKQSHRKLFCELDDFDEDVTTGDPANDRQQDIAVNDGNDDQQFTVTKNGINLATNEKSANV